MNKALSLRLDSVYLGERVCVFSGLTSFALFFFLSFSRTVQL